jgi:hypothetical protein
MASFRDTLIPESFYSVLPFMTQYSNDTCLMDILIWSESVIKKYIFIINTDIIDASEMLKRGTLNDIYNSKELNYLISQNHAYRLFAEGLNAPLIDIAKLRHKYSIQEIQEIIVRMVDCREKTETLEMKISDRRKYNKLLIFFSQRL